MTPSGRVLLPAVLLLALSLGYESSAGAQEGARAPVASGDRIRVVGLVGGSEVVVMLDDRLEVQLPLVGRLSLRGFSARAAGDTVRALAERFGRPEMIAVSFERRIPVIGEVRNPSLLYLDLTVRLREAVALSGGVIPGGHGSSLLLRRNGQTETVENWRTTASGDRELESGDQIIVPREQWYKRNIFPLISAFGLVTSIVLTLAVR